VTEPQVTGRMPDDGSGPLARYRQALPDLALRLRNAGLSIGPDRWQNVYDLLLALAERGQLPEEASALEPLIGPLLCRSGQEQRALGTVFRDWVDGLAPGLRGAEPVAERVRPAPWMPMPTGC
jgi:hypothetical protein